MAAMEIALKKIAHKIIFALRFACIANNMMSANNATPKCGNRERRNDKPRAPHRVDNLHVPNCRPPRREGDDGDEHGGDNY